MLTVALVSIKCDDDNKSADCRDQPNPSDQSRRLSSPDRDSLSEDNPGDLSTSSDSTSNRGLPMENDHNNTDRDELDMNVYSDSQITRRESLLAVIAHAVRHDTSGAALSDLLKLIDMYLPEGTPFVK